jgi:predicted 3-demethylubiquinone-9 3-methyltransferase (glyoxalase superfamily)
MPTIDSPRITPYLWFDNRAEEAAAFYTSLFPNSRIVRTTRYSEPVAEAAGQEAGSVMVVEFELDGMRFVGLNGGPVFQFTEAISFLIGCESQEEVDRYWTALADGGSEQQCGWLKDRFGISWQVVPTELFNMMESGQPERVGRISRALFQMKKIDLPALKRAYNGES